MENEDILNDTREKCYSCYRPKSSCMCEYINKIETNTKFVLLMHPKEFKKTKNGTGRFTHISLPNSSLFIGIDFNKHPLINEMINNPNNNCFVLYPGLSSIKLNSVNIQEENKTNIIFIIDSTWPCSKKMLAVSKNISGLPKISFEHTKSSAFKIKTQPNPYCLSTIESTLCVLELLNQHKIENIEDKNFEKFLEPFTQMVEYQVECATKPDRKVPRFLRREN
ncbi:MAG: DTW domain-containing protein [Arcobacteraceae bacterium]|nr:DTW domain-containing protein [Arcobacteraceae bacterium]